MFKKKTIILIILSSLLIGCTSKDSSTVIQSTSLNEPPSNILTTTNTHSSLNNIRNLVLGNQCITTSKFITYGNSIFFTDKINNYKISTLKIPTDTLTIKDDSILDIIDYPCDTLTYIGDDIYFSNISDKYSLYKLNYLKNQVSKISSETFYQLSSQNKKLYFVNKERNNSLSVFDIEKNKTTALTTDYCSQYILCGEYILYKNNSDNGSIYAIKTDGTDRTKITTDSIDSFVIYNSNILYISSQDHKLYYFDLLLNKSTQVGTISGTDLKRLNDNLYFINKSDSNSLYSITISENLSNAEISSVFNSSINEYYLTDHGIFIDSPLNTTLYISTKK